MRRFLRRIKRKFPVIRKIQQQLVQQQQVQRVCVPGHNNIVPGIEIHDRMSDKEKKFAKKVNNRWAGKKCGKIYGCKNVKGIQRCNNNINKIKNCPYTKNKCPEGYFDDRPGCREGIPSLNLEPGKLYGTCCCDETKCPEGWNAKIPVVEMNNVLSREERDIVNSLTQNNNKNIKMGENCSWGQSCENPNLERLQECVNLADRIDKCPLVPSKCPDGYFDRFPKCEDENEHVLCNVIKEQNLAGKSCLDIPETEDLEKCKAFFNLQKDISEKMNITENYVDLDSITTTQDQLAKTSSDVNNVLNYYSDIDDRLNSTLQTKKRLIQLNKEAENDKNVYILNIVSSSFFILLIMTVIILNLMDKLTVKKMYSILLILVGAWAFYVLFWAKVKTLPKLAADKTDGFIRQQQLLALQKNDKNCNCPDTYTHNENPRYYGQR